MNKHPLFSRSKLPTGIHLRMPLAEPGNGVPASMERSDGSYRYSEYDDRNFGLTLTVDNDSGTPDTLYLRCQTRDCG